MAKSSDTYELSEPAGYSFLDQEALRDGVADEPCYICGKPCGKHQSTVADGERRFVHADCQQRLGAAKAAKLAGSGAVVKGRAMMMKSPDMGEVADLKRDVASLKRQLDLVIAYLDVETRERLGLTSDQIRSVWRNRPAAVTANEAVISATGKGWAQGH